MNLDSNMDGENDIPTEDDVLKSNMSSAMGLFAPLAVGANMSADRFVELITIIAGGLGIQKLRKGSQELHEGKLQEGSTNIGQGNATLFGVALAGETIQQGAPGNYSFAELPMLFAALKDLSMHHPMFRRLLPIMQLYGPKTALVLNLLIHGSLAAAGQIDSIPKAINALGFTSLSTSFVMEAKQEVQNLRRILAVSGGALLFIGSLLQTVPSIGPFIQTHDLRELAVVPAIWTVLNGIFLWTEARILLERLDVSRRLEDVIQNAADALNPLDDASPALAEQYVYPYPRA